MKNTKKEKEDKEALDRKVKALVKDARGKEHAVETQKAVETLFKVKYTDKGFSNYKKKLFDSLRRLRAKGELAWVYTENKKSLIYYPTTPEELRRQIFRYKDLMKSSRKLADMLSKKLKAIEE